ncbi:MAG: hypothetical protein N3E37_03585 [Candidatus Micrarchaeota archaeon]|nr:hypothetical protein [Candidatus Micrarchaeota archaeon]
MVNDSNNYAETSLQQSSSAINEAIRLFIKRLDQSVRTNLDSLLKANKNFSAILSEIKKLVFDLVNAENQKPNSPVKFSFSYAYLLALQTAQAYLFQQITSMNQEKQKLQQNNAQQNQPKIQEIEKQVAQLSSIYNPLKENAESMKLASTSLVLGELIYLVLNNKHEQDPNLFQSVMRTTDPYNLLVAVNMFLGKVTQDYQSTDIHQFRTELLRMLREFYGIDYNRDNASKILDAMQMLHNYLEKEYQTRIAEFRSVLSSYELGKERKNVLNFQTSIVPQSGRHTRMGVDLSYQRILSRNSTVGFSINPFNQKEGYGFNYSTNNASISLFPQYSTLGIDTGIGNVSMFFSKHGVSGMLGPLSLDFTGSLSVSPLGILTTGQRLFMQHENYRREKKSTEKNLQEYLTALSKGEADTELIMRAAAASIRYMDLDPVTIRSTPMVSSLFGKEKSGRVWYSIEAIQRSFEKLINNQNASEIQLFIGKDFGSNKDGIFRLQLPQNSEERAGAIEEAKFFIMCQLLTALSDSAIFGGYRDMMRDRLTKPGNAIETLNKIINDLIGTSNTSEMVSLFYYDEKSKKFNIDLDKLFDLMNSINSITDQNKKYKTLVVIEYILTILQDSNSPHLRDTADYIKAQRFLADYNSRQQAGDQQGQIIQIQSSDTKNLIDILNGLNRKGYTSVKNRLLEEFQKIGIDSMHTLFGVLNDLKKHILQIDIFKAKYGKRIIDAELKTRYDYYKALVGLLTGLLKAVEKDQSLVMEMESLFREVRVRLRQQDNPQSQQANNRQINNLVRTLDADLFIIYTNISRRFESLNPDRRIVVPSVPQMTQQSQNSPQQQRAQTDQQRDAQRPGQEQQKLTN